MFHLSWCSTCPGAPLVPVPHLSWCSTCPCSPIVIDIFLSWVCFRLGGLLRGWCSCLEVPPAPEGSFVQKVAFLPRFSHPPPRGFLLSRFSTPGGTVILEVLYIRRFSVLGGFLFLEVLFLCNAFRPTGTRLLGILLILLSSCP